MLTICCTCANSFGIYLEHLRLPNYFGLLDDRAKVMQSTHRTIAPTSSSKQYVLSTRGLIAARHFYSRSKDPRGARKKISTSLVCGSAKISIGAAAQTPSSERCPFYPPWRGKTAALRRFDFSHPIDGKRNCCPKRRKWPPKPSIFAYFHKRVACYFGSILSPYFSPALSCCSQDNKQPFAMNREDIWRISSYFWFYRLSVTFRYAPFFLCQCHIYLTPRSSCQFFFSNHTRMISIPSTSSSELQLMLIKFPARIRDSRFTSDGQIKRNQDRMSISRH